MVGVPREKWIERPITFFFLNETQLPRTAPVLRVHLTSHGIARWWLLHEFIALAASPKTGIGKFDKERFGHGFAGYRLQCRMASD